MKKRSYILVVIFLMIIIFSLISCDLFFPPRDDGPDTTPPAEVIGLFISAGIESLTVTWTNPGDADFSHTEISYRKDSEAAYTPFAGAVSPGGTLLLGLEGGTLYHVKAVTVDTTGNKSPGVTNTGTPMEIDDTPPADVTDMTVLAIENCLQVTWTEPADADFSHCLLSYKLAADAVYTDFPGTLDETGTIITGLLPGAIYMVNLRTVDTSGNTSTPGETRNAVTGNDIDPGDVTGLTLTPGSSSITMSWTDPDIPDFKEHSIYYGINPNADIEFTGTADPAGTVINGLDPDTTYKVIIKVLDLADNASPGVEDTATTGPLAAGNIGPSGGYIFYVDGADEYPDWKYLEAAPLAWRTLANHTFPWATATTAPGEGVNYTQLNVTDARENSLDSGEANTQAIVERHPNPSSFPFAADICYDLTYNGFDDWFLPSQAQLDEMYANLHDQATPLGDFESNLYWSSVQGDTTESTSYLNDALVVDFSDGSTGIYEYDYKAEANVVRPVRSFTHWNMVKRPTLSDVDPDTATYLPATSITFSISCTTTDAEIYYTLDGTDPTTSSTLYSPPAGFAMPNGDTLLRIRAFKDGYDPSTIVEKLFVLSTE